MKRLTLSWESVLIASIVLVAGVCAQSQRSVWADDAPLDGPIVQIAPGGGGQELAELETESKTRIIEEQAYWIGIRGRSVASPVLRTHLQLAEDMGVVVEDVVPESPAAKAGLRKHDIILRAGNDAVDNMTVLQGQVQRDGGKTIELKIIRLGKPEKLVVVPELRPQQYSGPQPNVGEDRWDLLGGDVQDLMQQLLRGDGRLNAQRLFGPGIIVNGDRADINAMPGGMSISVQSQNDGPPHITVKKGDQTWNIVGDDQESFDQLPDDVRPFVERMLGRRGIGNPHGGAPIDLDADLLRRWPRRWGAGAEGDADPIVERMQELERKLQDLQDRLE